MSGATPDVDRSRRARVELAVQRLALVGLLVGAWNLLLVRVTPIGAIPGYSWIAPQIIWIGNDPATAQPVVVADLLLLLVCSLLAFIASR